MSLDMQTTISIIAGIVVISGSGGVLGILKLLRERRRRIDWSNSKSVFLKKKIMLSWNDAIKGIYEYLIPEAQKYNPDIIFGISRGGAIVGGMIAKQLGKQIFVLDIDTNRKSNDAIRQIQIPEPPQSNTLKILLVDDKTRTGKHMNIAVKYLNNRYPNSKIWSFVLLQIKLCVSPGYDVQEPPTIERAAYVSKINSTSLPWDIL